jgi:hypothetical protein
LDKKNFDLEVTLYLKIKDLGKEVGLVVYSKIRTRSM